MEIIVCVCDIYICVYTYNIHELVRGKNELSYSNNNFSYIYIIFFECYTEYALFQKKKPSTNSFGLWNWSDFHRNAHKLIFTVVENNNVEKNAAGPNRDFIITAKHKNICFGSFKPRFVLAFSEFTYDFTVMFFFLIRFFCRLKMLLVRSITITNRIYLLSGVLFRLHSKIEFYFVKN